MIDTTLGEKGSLRVLEGHKEIRESRSQEASTNTAGKPFIVNLGEREGCDS